MRATPIPGSKAPVVFTASTWAAQSEDEPGELVDGRLVEEEMPDLVHEAAVLWLALVLGPWLRARGGGSSVVPGCPGLLLHPDALWADIDDRVSEPS